MNNKAIIEFGFRRNNSADLAECYPPRPSAEVDNTLLDLQNSSYPTQPHSIIAKYMHLQLQKTRPFCSIFSFFFHKFFNTLSFFNKNKLNNI